MTCVSVGRSAVQARPSQRPPRFQSNAPHAVSAENASIRAARYPGGQLPRMPLFG